MNIDDFRCVKATFIGGPWDGEEIYDREFNPDFTALALDGYHLYSADQTTSSKFHINYNYVKHVPI